MKSNIIILNKVCFKAYYKYLLLFRSFIKIYCLAFYQISKKKTLIENVKIHCA